MWKSIKRKGELESDGMTSFEKGRALIVSLIVFGILCGGLSVTGIVRTSKGVMTPGQVTRFPFSKS